MIYTDISSTITFRFHQPNRTTATIALLATLGFGAACSSARRFGHLIGYMQTMPDMPHIHAIAMYTNLQTHNRIQIIHLKSSKCI